MIRLLCRNSWYGRALVISLCSLLAVPLSYANKYPKECDPTNPQKCSQPVLQGESVPFSGQLLTKELSIDLGMKAYSFDARLELELKFQRKGFDLDLQFQKRLRKIDRDAFQRQVKLCMTRLEETHSRSWYEHPVFVAAVSGILVFLFMLGARVTLKATD